MWLGARHQARFGDLAGERLRDSSISGRAASCCFLRSELSLSPPLASHWQPAALPKQRRAFLA